MNELPLTTVGKLQKHEIFENELNANHDRVEYLEDIGAKMMDNQHYASNDIRSGTPSADHIFFY